MAYSGGMLDYGAEGCGFKSHSGWQLENFTCSPSSKWVPDAGWGKVRQ